MVEAQVDESSQVDRGDSLCELCPVRLAASASDSAVSVCDHPCNGAFDHGPVLAIVVEERLVAPGLASGDKLVIMFRDRETPPVFGGGASLT